MWFFNTEKNVHMNYDLVGLSAKDMIIIPKYREELNKQKKRHLLLLQFEEKVFSLLTCFDKKITATLSSFFTFYNKEVSYGKRIKMNCFQLHVPCHETLLQNCIHTMFDDIDDLYILIVNEFLSDIP
jgi:hypothetical protein